jgi:ABC-2 type transport system permease protein
MRAFAALFTIGLRLAFRNRMALIYGYLFPLVFLVAFAVVYRNDPVPLALHVGELLTVTVLGGACFGLPTTVVSERERGVWRRYRLTPASGATVVLATLATRFVLLATAAAIQLALAAAIGMPAPAHPAALAVAFTVTTATFLALGMVIASVAGSVAAVQALGQCIFLPMLMIGGVAVRLSSLPEWALHLSAFFPGRYAVEALQNCATGGGLRASGFALAALAGMAVAAGIAAAALFRWDTAQPIRSARKTGALAAALAFWLLVGAAAEYSGTALAPVREVRDDLNIGVSDLVRSTPVPKPPAPTPRVTRTVTPSPTADASPEPEPWPSASASPANSAPPATSAPPGLGAPAWSRLTASDFAQVAFDRLPPDTGLVSPIAPPGETPDPLVADQLESIGAALENWPPAAIDDPVQRVRNHLYVLAVPDLLRVEGLERHLPRLVLRKLRRDLPERDLAQLLYWIATHPQDGDDAAVRQLAPLGLPEVAGPTRQVRTRVMVYAFKFLGRLTGDLR